MCSRHRTRERRWDTSKIPAQHLAYRSCSLKTRQPVRGLMATEIGMKPRPTSSQSKGFGRGTWLLPESWGLGLELMPAIHGYGHVIVRLWKGVGVCSEQCWWLLQRSGSTTGHPPLPTVLPLGACVLGGLVPSPTWAGLRSTVGTSALRPSSVQDPGDGCGESDMTFTYKCPPRGGSHCSLPGINTVFQGQRCSRSGTPQRFECSDFRNQNLQHCWDKISVYDPKSPQNRKTPGSPYTNNYFSINDSLKPFPWQENALFCMISTG